MPWTVKDVDEHKKGLTPAQKAKWVKVANGVLKKCQSEGGTNCDAKAIKIANSKFEEKVMAHKKDAVKVPKGALRFVGEGQTACAFKMDNEAPRMKMTAYNGKVIKDHWYWGDLAIDLDGMSFPSGKFPILENHDTDKKIAFHSGKPDTSENKLELLPDKTTFVDTETASEFIKLSGQGFPYQASIYAKPTEIHRLMKDEVGDVNGFSMKGPGTIWRKSQLKEASVCVFGWDSSTKSSAFSRESFEEVDYVENENSGSFAETEDTKNDEKGGEIMNLEELKAKYPDLVAQLSDEVKASVTNEVSATLNSEFDKERAKFNAEKTALETKLENGENRLAELEKKDALREEREREATADRIWNEKLSASDIGSHLYVKVKKMVSFAKFVKDDILDIEAFSAAVDEEIADWESRGASVNVSGLGVVGRDAVNSNVSPAAKEENVKLSNDLLSRAGQQVSA